MPQRKLTDLNDETAEDDVAAQASLIRVFGAARGNAAAATLDEERDYILDSVVSTRIEMPQRIL